MHPSTPVSTIQQAYAAFQSGDIAKLLTMLSGDVEWHTYGPAELPMGGARRGPAEVGKFFEQVGGAWSFTRFEPREFIAQGDIVVSLGRYEGTARSTGRPFASNFTHVFGVREGRIESFREYTDTANLIGALAGNPARV